MKYQQNFKFVLHCHSNDHEMFCMKKFLIKSNNFVNEYFPIVSIQNNVPLILVLYLRKTHFLTLSLNLVLSLSRIKAKHKEPKNIKNQNF